ncbi:MAG: hypothetical protein LUJ09_06890 [Firmicutes bacterium]|nr:hypothetical protein [Bacillota bacterium]
MKPRRIYALALALCLLLAGCTHADPSGTDAIALYDLTALPGQDAPNSNNVVIFPLSFTGTEGYYYGTMALDNYVYYYDQASGVSDVLCADPSCTHDSNTCSAYISEMNSLNVYDGKLYWVGKDPADEDDHDYYLWCSDLTGANRQKGLKISNTDVVLEYSPQVYYIHRDRLYFIGHNNIVDGTETSLRDTLFSIPLDGGEDFTCIYEITTVNGAALTPRFVGNTIFLGVYITEDTDQELAEESHGEDRELQVIQYDIPTGESRVVYQETDFPEYFGRPWVTADGEIYLTSSDNEQSTHLWKLEDGSRTEIVSWQGAGSATAGDGAAIFTWTDDNGVRMADVVSLDGEPIYSGMLFPEGIPGLDDLNMISYGLLSIDEDYVFLFLFEPFSGTNYVARLDLHNNLEPTILWGN